MLNDEEIITFKATGNLIEDIIIYKDYHSFEKVCIFLEKNYDVTNVSTAFALKEFIDSIDIPCDIIASRPNLLKRFYKGTKPMATGKFIAITIGCKTIGDIDLYSNYQDTFVLFHVCGPIKVKGYGVLNYVSSNVSCSAEIVFNNIFEYAEKHDKQISRTIAQHLYTALVAGTKRYGTNIKSNTFLVAKRLLELGADYKEANYLCEKKDPLVLQVQEKIYKTLVRDDRLCYAFVKESELPAETTVDILQDTLNLFKKVDKIDVWVLFEDNGNGYYSVVLQGKEINPFSIEQITRKNNGFGDHTSGRCIVRTCDVNKILGEIKLMFERADAEEASYNDEDLCNDEILDETEEKSYE